jgi:phosphatidylserine/phosphatidylglycerophosphate/cardiolipin synthase-like enzyme
MPTGSMGVPAGRVMAAILVVLFWQACGEEHYTPVDTSEDPQGDPDAIPDSPPDNPIDVPPDVPPDGETDPITDRIPDGDAPADPDVDAWECGCPETPVTTCGVVDRVAFSVWDDSLTQQILGTIACARSSLDIAMYDVQWDCIVDALLDAKEALPALRIRVITDNYTCGEAGALTCDLQRLVEAGAAEVLPDNRSYLMHDKLVIVDAGQADAWALVGSANWTRQSFCEESNGNVVVEDDAIVAGLSAEFERMMGGEFGNTTWAEPIASTGMDLYFSPPGDDWQDEIVAELGALPAGATVRFMNYSFTRTDLADAFVAAHGRGVDVAGIVSRMFASEVAVANMLAAGIVVRKALVHHKALIIQSGSQKTVIMGSGNYSTNARVENNEIVIFFRNDAELYDAYAEEFDRIQAVAEDI